MGLLLFWNSSEPAVIVITDGGVKPQIFFVKGDNVLAPQMQIVELDNAHLVLLGKTIAVADTTTTVYNDANTTYSSSTQTYGGSDRIVDPAPQIVKVGQ